jgi:acyl-CoA hydrolase
MYTPDASRTHIFQPVLEEHCNNLNQVQAGYLLKLIDIIGAYCALKHVNNQVTIVTASLDRTNFSAAIKLWEFIAMECHITQVWGSSMEVEVNVYGVSMRPETNVRGVSIDSNGMQRRHVATAYLVYVGFDKNRQKATLPKITHTRPSELAASYTADLRKQHRFAEAKDVPLIPINSESDCNHWVEVNKVATPRDANINGNVFGGVILEEITNTARKAAEKHCLGATVVGARMDRMSFLAPGYIGETIRTRAILTATFKTSMELQVEVHAINPNKPDSPRLIASSYMIFVRLTPQGTPADVPPWEATTDLQLERLHAAKKRREGRNNEKKEIPQLAAQATANSVNFYQQVKLSFSEIAQRITMAFDIITGQVPKRWSSFPE